jgi:hypothetical protein
MIILKLRVRTANPSRITRVTYELLDDNLVRVEKCVTSTKNFGNQLTNLKRFKWADEKKSKEVYNRL